MRWLMLFALLGMAPAIAADTVRVCYNYDCLNEDDAHYTDGQLTQLRALLGTARNAAEEREKLSLAIGWMLAWAGQQTPIHADRGGNFADDGVFGRMDCIDHSTTTTRLLRLLEEHGWLNFHQLVEPARRIRYLVAVHFSAQIEERDPLAAPARYVVDSWFRDNGQPAVVTALANWLAGEGEGEEESVGPAVVAGGPGDGLPNQR